MKEKILPWTVSVVLTTCLFSGVVLAQQFAFYVLFVCNIIGWLGVLAMGSLGKETLLKLSSFPVIAWSLTAAQIFALVYSGHTMLAASSLLSSTLIYCGALANLKKLES